MDNKELNEKLNIGCFDSTDYQINISDKKSFFANLLDKLKSTKKQKLLPSGNSSKARTTHRSISSLWKVGTFKASLFNTIYSFNKIIIEKLSTKNSTNKSEPKNQIENFQEKTKETLENSTYTIPIVKLRNINIKEKTIFTKTNQNPKHDDFER